MKKKKKVEKMTSEEASEELKKTMTKLEKLMPELESEFSDIVGRMIKINKLFYAISKDEKQRKELTELLRTDENFRRELFEYASTTDNLERALYECEDLARQILEKLKKKQKEKKKREG